MMNYMVLTLSALTAFIIGGGGVVIGVVGSGNELNYKVWIISAVIGAMSASKDIRSSMRLPPVPANGTDTTLTKKP